MKSVGSTDVDSIDVDIRQKITVITGGSRNAERFGKRTRRLNRASSHTHYLDVAEPPQRLGGDPAHGNNSENSYFNLFQGIPIFSAARAALSSHTLNHKARDLTSIRRNQISANSISIAIFPRVRGIYFPGFCGSGCCSIEAA